MSLFQTIYLNIKQGIQNIKASLAFSAGIQYFFVHSITSI